MLDIKHKKINKGTYSHIIITFLFLLIITWAISQLVLNGLWRSNREIVHMVLELLSVFIGAATFLIVWNKKDDDNSINNILGFGFLIVSLLDIMHTYYYKDFLLNNIIEGENSLKYWLAARLVEVTTLFVFAYAPYVRNGNRYIKMIGTIIITGCLFYAFEVYPDWGPSFYNENGLTQTKSLLEYVVIIIAVLALYKLKKNLRSEQLIKFEDLYICILLIIPSEICFTLFKNSDSFWVVWGHILKIFSYFYLYKAVFQSLIHYPYDKLRDSNEQLSKMLHKFGTETEEVSLSKVNTNKKDTKNLIKTYLDAYHNRIKILIKACKIKAGIIPITNDAKQEQQIKNLKFQAQAILNAVAAPTIIMDYMGNIAACNRAFAELVEVEYEEILKMTIDKLNDITNFSDKELAYLLESGDFREGINTCTIRTPKGAKKEIEIRTVLITNIYNKKIGLMGVVEDVSKMREEQLKRINQEKLALLGQMGATIIHETRNYLSTIKGNCQLIELYLDPERVGKYTRKINEATDEINRIISDFLNLSKPREAELKEIAFNDLVSSMKSTIQTSSLINKVQVFLELNYDERYILCDETQMRQVILNMCKNAVEAMTEISEPALHISTGLDEHANEVFIKISDNGVGIDNKILKKIGTPFFTTKKTGTGLGLNVCYQIIKDHRGRVEVESELGRGTTFTITIPCIEEASEDAI